MAQTTNARQLIFINHPNIIFPAVATVLAFPALSPTPSFIPLTILVATVLVYTRIVFPRPHAARTIFSAIFGKITTTQTRIGAQFLHQKL